MISLKKMQSEKLANFNKKSPVRQKKKKTVENFTSPKEFERIQHGNSSIETIRDK